MQTKAHTCFESICVSDSWLICETGYSFKIFNIEDLVWFYQLISKRKLYFIIPIWKTNKLVLGLRTKKLFHSGNLQEQTINSAIKYISSQIPWAFAGFSIEANNVWAKSPQQLIDLADQRKSEYLTVQANSESAEAVSTTDDQPNNEESPDQTII